MSVHYLATDPTSDLAKLPVRLVHSGPLKTEAACGDRYTFDVSSIMMAR